MEGSSPYSGDSSIASDAAVSGTARGVSVSISIFANDARLAEKSNSRRRLPGSRERLEDARDTVTAMCGRGGTSRVPLDRGVRTRARGDARARACGAEPEADVAPFGKRDSTSVVFFIRRDAFYRRVNSLEFRTGVFSFLFDRTATAVSRVDLFCLCSKAWLGLFDSVSRVSPNGAVF